MSAFDKWLDGHLAKIGWTRATLSTADVKNMRFAWDAAIEAAASTCEQWGEDKVEKWDAIGDDEMLTDAKARAWDSLQCAAAARELKTPPR